MNFEWNFSLWKYFLNQIDDKCVSRTWFLYISKNSLCNTYKPNYKSFLIKNVISYVIVVGTILDIKSSKMRNRLSIIRYVLFKISLLGFKPKIICNDGGSFEKKNNNNNRNHNHRYCRQNLRKNKTPLWIPSQNPLRTSVRLKIKNKKKQ